MEHLLGKKLKKMRSPKSAKKNKKKTLKTELSKTLHFGVKPKMANGTFVEKKSGRREFCFPKIDLW